jgi:S-adenosylmethionine:tRNA ribosyltransferase-isomerase
VTPAATYPQHRDEVRLLVVDAAAARYREARMRDLAMLLAPGDLVVVNDAATLPASLRGHDGHGRELEARLLSHHGEGRFQAVLFGGGDWRQRTEDRPPPPPLAAGAELMFGTLGARLVERSPISPRLVTLRFDASGAALWAGIYESGRPVQYSYLAHELPLWAVQTAYAGRPWAFEMPSAGRPLSWEILLALRRRGVSWAALTHAAGLSATGDPALDAALPLAERFDIPASTADAVLRTRRERGRVIAVGTTVVRALEGAAALWGTLRAGSGETELRIADGYRPRVADGILTGMHGAGESHFALLHAFAPGPLLEAASRHAEAAGFRSHELGDAMLVLPPPHSASRGLPHGLQARVAVGCMASTRSSKGVAHARRDGGHLPGAR